MSQIAGDVAGVKNTFSSWDACMSKSYCKWPVIVAIIVGSLIVLSVVFCLVRCLCCGAECCCACMSCCNSCCPSGRKNRGYQQPPPTPYQSHPVYNQYQPAQPPTYASGALGYRGAQTATFDAPSGHKSAAFNEDALPAMPSWDTATSRRVEEEVEMEKLDTPQAQQKPLMPEHQHDDLNAQFYGDGHQQHSQAGDMGTMSATPYHDYQQHQQFAPSPYGSQHGGSQHSSAYPPTYHTNPPVSPSVYSSTPAYGGGYERNPVPYHPSPTVSPIYEPAQQQQQHRYAPARPGQYGQF